MTWFIQTRFVPNQGDERLKLDLEEIPGISTRGAIALRGNGCKTVADVLKIESLRRFSNIGGKEAQGIIEGLSEMFNLDLTEGVSREERKRAEQMLRDRRNKR